MDIISHGLYGGVAFGRKSKRDYWWSFAFGIAPDFFSFGIFTVMTVLGLSSRPDWSHGVPRNDAVPQYVHSLYNVTHSLVIFAVVFLIVWGLSPKNRFSPCSHGRSISSLIYRSIPRPFSRPRSFGRFSAISASTAFPGANR